MSDDDLGMIIGSVEEGGIHARDIPPSYATELGYNMYMADHAPEHSRIRASAIRVVHDFDVVMRQFKPGTPDGLYVLKLRTFATALARGISSRRMIRERRIRIAEQQWDVARTQMVSQEHWAGVMRGAWQILLLGGFVFVVLQLVVQVVLGSPGIREHPGSKDATVASLATTLGICLISSYGKAFSMRRRLEKLGKDYNEQLSRAEREYVASARIEYELCATQSSAAWRTLTGQPPPMGTIAFNNLITGLVSEDELDPSKFRKKEAVFIRTIRIIWRRYQQRMRNGEQAQRESLPDPDC